MGTRLLLLGVVFSIVASCAGRTKSLDLANEPQRIKSLPDRTTQFDFSNFTFPATAEWGSFELKGGESPTSLNEGEMKYALVDTTIGQVGNLSSAAVAVVTVQTGGSAIPHLVYLFDTTGPQPKLVWSMVSGDRADGGLRRAFLSGGRLNIEAYQPEGARGDCCPKSYIARSYELRGQSLKLVAELRRKTNPEHSAVFLKSSE